MIEAVAALSDSAGRMAVEPVAARKGLEEMAALLMAAHGFIAELSAARLDMLSGGSAPDSALRAWLQRRLLPTAREASSDGPHPSGPVAQAALAVLDAADRYQRAVRSELAGS